MRTIFLGIFGFFISGVFLLPQVSTQFQLPAEFFVYAPVSLMVVALLTQVDGYLNLKKLIQSRKLSSENDALDAELKDTIEKLHDEKKLVTDFKTKVAQSEKHMKTQDRLLLELKNDSEDQVKKLKNALNSEKSRQEQLSRDLEALTLKNSAGDGRVVQFLSLLQEKGRFLDFIMDDVSKFQDQQVGAAARVVHSGCSQVMKEFFEILPVRSESEGSEVTLTEDEPSEFHRLLGQVGAPPWQGRLVHKGWKTEKVNLPELMDSARAGQQISSIISPAQVELS